MMKNKKRIMGLLITIIFVCILVMPKDVNAIASPIYLYSIEDIEEELYEGHIQNEAGTVTYDEENSTLTLDNYEGGPIEIFLDTDLTIILKGENVITADEDTCGIITYYGGGIVITGDGSLVIKNANEGLTIQSDKLQIDSGDITITDAYNNAIDVNGDFILNDGNLVINYTVDKVLMGIFSNAKVIINGGSIVMDTVEAGIQSSESTNINDGKVIINSDRFGILCAGLLSIKSDYLEINTPEENTSAIFAVVSDDFDALDIDSNLVMDKNDITKQKVLIAPDNEMYVITLGKTGATMEMEYNIIDLITSNVANSVKIYKTKNVSFNTKGGSSIDDLTVPYGTTVERPTDPTKNGYSFGGWYLDSTYDVEFDFDTPITDDITLYAKWEDIQEKYSYTFEKGDKQELNLDDIDSFTFTIDGDYSLFENVKIGNLNLIKDEDYIVTEGSTIITFTDKGIAKLNTMKKGTYDILVTYSNGKSVTGSLILNRILPPNPKTGDNINYYIIIAITSLLGLIGSAFYVKKKLIN